MKFSETYIGRLREKIGNDLLQVPGGRIVLEDKEGRVLLQKRSDFGLWGLPAGSPEEGESASTSIKREVLEETGLIVSKLNCFGYSSNPEYETIQYPNGHMIHCYSEEPVKPQLSSLGYKGLPPLGCTVGFPGPL